MSAVVGAEPEGQMWEGAGLREPKERKEDLKRVGRQSGWTGHVLMAASENLPSL